LTGFPGSVHAEEAGTSPQRSGIAVEPPLLWRGLALAVTALALVRLATSITRASAWLLPLSLVLVGGAVSAAWASVIQFTGGVRHDDHPWV